MIKELEFRDIPALMPYIRCKREVFGVTEQEAANLDMNHYKQMAGHWLDSNCSFISVSSEGLVNGFALGGIYPHMWSPNRKELYLVGIAADSPFTGGKLFKTWHERALSVPAHSILVDSISMTNINYEKLGYKPLRTTYEMEKTNG